MWILILVKVISVIDHFSKDSHKEIELLNKEQIEHFWISSTNLLLRQNQMRVLLIKVFI